jgi:uncharacterized membrane protein
MDVLILKKMLFILVGIVLLIAAITLYRLGYIGSGVMMIMSMIAGLSVGSAFKGDIKK